MRALAEHGGLMPPTVGDEIPEGIMVDVSWPHARIAVELPTMPAEDRDDLEAAGWRVVERDDRRRRRSARRHEGKRRCRRSS